MISLSTSTIWEPGSVIPLDLSTNLGVGIYDPIGSQIQILGIGSRDPFLGSMDMSAYHHIYQSSYLSSVYHRTCSFHPLIDIYFLAMVELTDMNMLACTGWFTKVSHILFLHRRCMNEANGFQRKWFPSSSPKCVFSTKRSNVKGLKIVKFRYLMNIVIYLFVLGCNK